MRPSLFSLVSLSLAIAGCSAVINPDVDRLGDRADAGRADTDVRPDTGRRDSSTGCDPSEPPRCEDETYVECIGGYPHRDRLLARRSLLFAERGLCSVGVHSGFGGVLPRSLFDPLCAQSAAPGSPR